MYSINDAGPDFSSLTINYDSLRVAVNNFPASSEFGSGVGEVVSSITGGVDIPSSATHGAFSVSGYARTASDVGVAVGVFGMGQINADGMAGISSWGGNFIATNCAAQVCATNTGHTVINTYGVEIDTNLMKSGGGAPAGNSTGLYITGGSEIQPAGNTNAIMIDPMGVFASPVIPWKNGLQFNDGSASGSAITVGVTGRGVNNVGSMPIYLNSRTAGGVVLQSTILTDGTGDLILRGGPGGEIVLEDGAANIGLQMFPNAGTPYIQIPNIKSTTGQRFVCVDTAGRLVSSASACVGT